MKIVDLTKEKFTDEVLACKEPVIISFWEENNAVCDAQNAMLEAIAAQIENQIKICKVNVNEETSLALDYGVTSTPTLVSMHWGLFQDRMIGLTDPQTIQKSIDKMLAQ
ncbi:MAG: thioredoxin domain-containing protein [Agathobacter sp.]|nr:thioredoxin domain-containing protein [Agathobacter sp.]